MNRPFILAALCLALLAIAQSAAPHSAPAPSLPSTPAKELNLDQAFARLHNVPEIKAWFASVQTHGNKPLLADIEQHPIKIHGVRYRRINFAEDNGVNSHRWETFVVRLHDGAIFIDSGMDGDHLRTLATWRKEDRPLDRIKPESPAASSAFASVPAPAEVPPYRIGSYGMEPVSGHEFVIVTVEVLGMSGATATGRTLTLDARENGYNGKFLIRKTEPIPSLNASGKASIPFRIPFSDGRGHLLIQTTISGQGDDAKRIRTLIID